MDNLHFSVPDALFWPPPPAEPAAEEKDRRARLATAVALIAAVALIVAMTGAIYIGYTRPVHKPPVSASVLNSIILVTETLKTGASQVSQMSDGQSWQDEWLFTSDCPTATCPAQLAGSFDNTTFSALLTPDKHGHYTGSAQVNDYFVCGNNNYSNTTLAIRITPTAARTVGKQWVTSAFTGSMTWNIHGTQDCGGAMLSFSVHG